MNEQWVALAITQLPALIQGFKEAFVKQNPDLPAPSSEDVIIAFNEAYASSLAVDDAWRAAHPE